jgi:hypothetical protein
LFHVFEQFNNIITISQNSEPPHSERKRNTRAGKHLPAVRVFNAFFIGVFEDIKHAHTHSTILTFPKRIPPISISEINKTRRYITWVLLHNMGFITLALRSSN